MQVLRRRATVFLSGLGVGLILATAGNVAADSDPKKVLPLEHILAFTDVFTQIKEGYVEDVDDQTLLKNAIKGMLAGLDPHSTYLEPTEATDLRANTTGQFGGLGIEVSMENGFVKVIAPFDDTPADRAGVKAGDVIIRLDETPVKGLSLNEAVKLMRGKPGSKLKLTIVREGEQKPIVITVVRDVIRVTSTKGRMLEPGYGYIRITQFQSPTPDNLRRRLARLARDNKAPLKGLVLDLRNNPGGSLDAAIGVSDAFLSSGTIVTTDGRTAAAKSKHDATSTDLLNGAPIVVLVNGGSASASEIVAGALKDHKRAVIMGQRTFGKGSVQNVINLKNNHALKLTTARYFTPSGTSIQARGIAPDIVLQNVTLDGDGANSENLSEANLSGHLDGAPGKRTGDDGKDKDAKNAERARKLAAEDYQLFEALNVLKGLGIYNARSGDAVSKTGKS
ncbi:MAG: S41 family peptidase [Pseudomonadota bacterium]